jgi:2-methylcitrate dehydratase
MIAVAEATGATVRDLVVALWISYEVVGALGQDADFSGRGLRPFIISLATVAGSAKLLGLTDDQLANAIAISIAPGIPLTIDNLIRQSHWKSVSAAHASMSATFAARLALAGLTGPPHIFDGPGAVWEQATGRFTFDHLGVPVDGKTVPERVTQKYFPSFTESQGPLAIALDLRDEIGLHDIESITLSVSDVAWRQGAGERTPDNRRWDPPTKDVANHSFPFLVAKTLVDGAITPDSFGIDDVADASLRPLMQKISVVVDDSFSERRRRLGEENAVLEIELRDGRRLTRQSVHPRGHPSNPMTDEELTKKFDGSVARVLPEPAHGELRGRLWNLPEETDLGLVTALLRQFTSTP